MARVSLMRRPRAQCNSAFSRVLVRAERPGGAHSPARMHGMVAGLAAHREAPGPHRLSELGVGSRADMADYLDNADAVESSQDRADAHSHRRD